MKRKTQEELGWPKSLLKKDLEEILTTILGEPMGKEWDDKLQKYLHKMIYSKDRESIENATRALSKLMKEKEKKYPTRKASKGKLGFSGPMFSVEEEILSEEFAEKAAKELNEALSDQDQ